ncbi:MAG: hypothetical protein HQL74_00890 [Magnetococcales bacterium]|nr:hypothetical protein [Magnetococcales bacterium]
MYSVEDPDMVRVVVFAEGQTEEQFIKRVVAPALLPSMVFLEPQLAAERITLEVIEKNCPHFRGWMEKLRKLSPHWPQ